MTTQHLGRVGSAPATPAPGIDLYYQLADGHAYLINSVGTFDLTAGIVVHNNLGSIQGGGATERYHLTAAQHTIAIQAATASLNGYLATADWNTFNNKSSYADPLTTDGDVLIRDTTTKRLPKGTDDQVLTLASGLPVWADSVGGGGGYPPMHVDGLLAEWVSATTMRINTGNCRSDDDTFDMVLASSKDAVITVGGAGGLDTGSEAGSTGYYLWLIYDSTTPTYAALLSTSATAPSLPGDYDKKRLIGYSYNNSSNDLLEFKQYGTGRIRYVHYNEPRQTVLRLLSGGTGGWADVDCSTLVPANAIKVNIHMQHATSGIGYVRPNAMGSSTGGVTFCFAGNENTVEVALDDQTIEYDTSAGSLTLDLSGYTAQI